MNPEFYKKDGTDWCRLTIGTKTIIDAPTATVLDIMAGMGLLLLAAFLLALAAHTKLKLTNT